MTGRCLQEDCNAPEVSCSLGEMEITDCPHWQAVALGVTEDALPAPTDLPAKVHFAFPWTGNAFGSTDLPYLTGSSRTRLIGVMGASDAGKTSLLATFYLLLGRGVAPEEYSFGGSLTLEGWENIANSLRWSDNGPSFPPHTSSGTGRRPGTLHLTVSGCGVLHELLCADSPGEWFDEWAINPDSQAAIGARWVATRADVFLVTADSKALSGKDRGVARSALIDLLRRLGTERGTRPVALVWTKSDITVATAVRDAITDAAKRSLGDFKQFDVSLKPAEGAETQNRGQNLLELFEWLLTVKDEPPKSVEVVEKVYAEKALLLRFGSV